MIDERNEWANFSPLTFTDRSQQQPFIQLQSKAFFENEIRNEPETFLKDERVREREREKNCRHTTIRSWFFDESKKGVGVSAPPATGAAATSWPPATTKSWPTVMSSKEQN